MEGAEYTIGNPELHNYDDDDSIVTMFGYASYEYLKHYSLFLLISQTRISLAGSPPQDQKEQISSCGQDNDDDDDDDDEEEEEEGGWWWWWWWWGWWWWGGGGGGGSSYVRVWIYVIWMFRPPDSISSNNKKSDWHQLQSHLMDQVKFRAAWRGEVVCDDDVL